MLPLTDLFGAPIAVPAIAVINPPFPKRRSDPAKLLEASRKRAAKKAAANPTAWLFEEVLEWLRGSVLQIDMLPREYRSDRRSVELDYIAEEKEEGKQEVASGEEGASDRMPYEAWGPAWVTDANGLHWSTTGVEHLQNHMFWESMEEMALKNNELEKWSVLKWMFRPAIRKEYIWDERIGRSHEFQWHESSETFSFHNCCIAARMDEHEIRQGFRRNIPSEIIKEVEKVVLA